jgi:TPP-dependent pyruvate/acetoin dehydrogenase alpha subunit
VASFFGDGAAEEGVFHESLNFAALKRLPVIFVCENNRYAIHTHQSKRQAFPSICGLVEAYGIPAERIDDNDVLAIHQRVGLAAEALRGGAPGPRFFECMTYRWREHVGPNEDYQLGYRSPAEAEPWKAGDQVPRLAAMLDPQVRQSLEAEVEAEIEEAFEFAEFSPFPPPEDLSTGVYRRC